MELYIQKNNIKVKKQKIIFELTWEVSILILTFDGDTGRSYI